MKTKEYEEDDELQLAINGQKMVEEVGSRNEGKADEVDFLIEQGLLEIPKCESFSSYDDDDDDYDEEIDYDDIDIDEELKKLGVTEEILEELLK